MGVFGPTGAAVIFVILVAAFGLYGALVIIFLMLYLVATNPEQALDLFYDILLYGAIACFAISIISSIVIGCVCKCICAICNCLCCGCCNDDDKQRQIEMQQRGHV